MSHTKNIYEIWENDSSRTLVQSERSESLRADGVIEKDAKIIHKFFAETYEEACTIYDGLLKKTQQ